MLKSLVPVLLATLSLACPLIASPLATQSSSLSESAPNIEGGFSINTDLLASLGDADLAAAQAIDSRNLTDDKNTNDINNDNNNINNNNNKNNNNNNNNNNINNNKSNDVTVLPNHVCSREETYVEQVKTPSMQPVRIRTSNWCLEFPPRCSNYKTELREVMKIQNLTKTRTIRFCCDGYAGNISVNDTVCKPVCRGGCGRGYCQKPDLCSCDAGYTGKHCTQRCDHDHWGEECRNLCRCENGAVCDNKSGLCHCTTGWTGELCELPCPEGTFGVMCRKSCDCSDKRCHPQSGECEKTNNSTTATIDPIPEQDPPVLKPELNATHVMIQTLNSTIANITHNLDRIAKNIVNIATTTADPVTFLLAEGGVGVETTPSPSVIVIKQNDQGHHQQPKIIVHQAPGGVGAGGLLENLHTGGSNAPEVIHVITNWQQQHHLHPNGSLDLAAIGAGVGHGGVAQPPPPPVAEHDSTLLTTLFVILLLIMVAIAIGFLYVYRRYHWQKQRVEAALAERTAMGRHLAPGQGAGHMEASTLGMGTATTTTMKSFLKPLPDLPGFTQMVNNKIDVPTYYDSPSSNASSSKNPSYSYARKESIYSVVGPKSRKCSQDSHLYDEIRYQSEHQQQMQHQLQQQLQQLHDHHHQQQQLQTHHQHQLHQQQHQHGLHNPEQSSIMNQEHHQSQLQHQSQDHHHQSQREKQLPHPLLPPQNANFLQVPKAIPHRINHM